MAARTLPTLPSWLAYQGITSTQLNQLAAYMAFWANPPSFRAEQHTSQSIPNSGSGTQITCETVIHDSDNGLSPTSPYSYIVPFAGIWDFFGGAGFSGNANGIRIPLLSQNGSTSYINGTQAEQIPNSTASVYLTEAVGIPCQVGDVIGLSGLQTSGAALATVAGGWACSWFAGRLVSLQSP